MGSAVCAAVALDPELDLVAAVDPYAAGQMIEGMAAFRRRRRSWMRAPRWSSTSRSPTQHGATVLWLAIPGIHTVVGTTGLTDEDLETFAHEFRGDDAPNCAVVPDFSISAVLMMRCAELARRSSTRSRSSSCTTTPRPMRRRTAVTTAERITRRLRGDG